MESLNLLNFIPDMKILKKILSRCMDIMPLGLFQDLAASYRIHIRLQTPMHTYQQTYLQKNPNFERATQDSQFRPLP